MSIRKLSRGISLNLEERRRLRSPSPLQIAIADRFSQLSEPAWQAATAGGSFFHAAAYLRAVERFFPRARSSGPPACVRLRRSLPPVCGRGGASRPRVAAA